MAGLLQSLRRAFTGTEARPGPEGGREAGGPVRQDEEYGRVGGEETPAAVAALKERDGLAGDADDGVYVKPTPITYGQTVTVWYSGLLARHGADQVYLHCGFGPGAWKDVRDVPMIRVGWIGEVPLWEAEVRATGTGTLELCFRDSADHWDNNSGHNWVYQIHWGVR